MDVVCGRCRAEYEFDNALISERGTTVRCTNCGLQFKVFPPAGQRAPELWQVFDAQDPLTAKQSFETVAELQRAIARGAVLATDLLARGEEVPRPLSSIIELQPLLAQPVSEPPPPLESNEGKPAGPGPLPRTLGGTVLGIKTRPNPALGADAPAPPGAAVPAPRDLGEEVVPAAEEFAHALTSPAPLPQTPQTPQTSKLKIRSALSINPGGDTAPRSERATPSTLTGTSIRPPRTSLRSTLASSAPPSSDKSPSSEGNGRGPSSRPSVPPSRPSYPPPKAPLAPDRDPTVVESTTAEVSPIPQTSESRPHQAFQNVAPEPSLRESLSLPSQLTPTPAALSAYESAHAEPVSSVAGMPVQRQARSRGVVLFVFLGGVSFLAFAARDRVTDLISPASSEQSSQEAAGLTSEQVQEAERLEILWVESHLLSDTPPDKPSPSAAELAAHLESLRASGNEKSWEAVDVLRKQGKLTLARRLAGELSSSRPNPYSLALLDLVEEQSTPPWAMVLGNLKEASVGERGAFLARSVFIYATAESGKLLQARADFESLSKLETAKHARVVAALRLYLERRASEDDGTEAEAQEDDAVQTEAAVQPGLEAEEAADEIAVPAPLPKPDPKETRAPALEPEPKPAPQAEPPKAPTVSPEIEEKVKQADALWRGGNQEGALVLYQQVVSAIGTSHFLGQRSAARIRQAEREKEGQ